MRIVQINGGVFGSTGKIMGGIYRLLSLHGHEVMCFSPITQTNRRSQPDFPYKRIGNSFSRKFSVLFGRVTGFHDCGSFFCTLCLLKKIKRFNPDIIQLHTIHGDYISLPLLFSFIKKHKIRVVWTLHDCWSFTGHCPHFTIQNCEKWKTGCYSCPVYRGYPHSLFDNSKKMYGLKKKWFSGISACMLVTPSNWLAGLVKHSFLSQYPVRVIHNGIDLSVFCPTPSDFRQRLGLEEKKLILGVSFGWNNKKGLDVFIRLAAQMPEEYAVMLVGTDEDVDKLLPESVISISRTQNQKELAQIYSAADVFVNPTREETLGLVNIEALACGTPVVTFNTGGAVESVTQDTGIVVQQDDFPALVNAIKKLSDNSAELSNACVKRAAEFNEKNVYKKYEEAYKQWSSTEEKN